MLFGLRFDFRNPAIAGTTMADRYAAALDIAQWADRLGCVSIAVSEHHGSPDGHVFGSLADRHKKHNGLLAINTTAQRSRTAPSPGAASDGRS